MTKSDPFGFDMSIKSAKKKNPRGRRGMTGEFETSQRECEHPGCTEPGKFRNVVDEIAEIHETGRPVLVGTVSIEKSEQLPSHKSGAAGDKGLHQYSSEKGTGRAG